jgi:cyanophycinase
MRNEVIWAASLVTGVCLIAAEAGGPAKGSLLVVGGGRLTPAIVQKFVDLAGGSDQLLVVIPTADGRAEADPRSGDFLKRAGATQVVVLHTLDRAEADTDAFVEPLKRARGVWFTGGRQWRLVDSYLNTKVHRELEALLARGGVIGGTSAGATIQGSYLVRGAREGNTIMMAPGYEQGMGFLRNTAIDQHLLKRNRQNDLLEVIDRHPGLLGIGIDESTAIVVEKDRFEVIGESKVAIYDSGYRPPAGEPRYYFLEPGDRFDLKLRRRLSAAADR